MNVLKFRAETERVILVNICEELELRDYVPWVVRRLSTSSGTIVVAVSEVVEQSWSPSPRLLRGERRSPHVSSSEIVFRSRSISVTSH